MLAPYALTALMHKPDRLIYLSSGMHLGGDPSREDPQWSRRRWNGVQAYSETKLHDVLLTFAVTRRWPGVPSNVISPGWIPTRMGGRGAPDDLDQVHRTQAWLAAGDDPKARKTGRFLSPQRPADLHPAARDHELQGRLLDYCRELSGGALA